MLFFKPNIEKLRNKKDVKGLLVALRNNDIAIRSQAISALGELKVLDALEEIIPLLKNDNTHIKILAVSAIGKIGDRKTIDHIIPLLNDKNKKVRSEAIETIRMLRGDEVLNEILNEQINKYFKESEVHEKKENYSKAISIMKKILDIDSKNAMALSNIGYYFFKLNSFSDGISYLNKALKIDPENKYIKNRFYEVLSYLGNDLDNLYIFDSDEKIITHIINFVKENNIDQVLATGGGGMGMDYKLKKVIEEFPEFTTISADGDARKAFEIINSDPKNKFFIWTPLTDNVIGRFFLKSPVINYTALVLLLGIWPYEKYFRTLKYSVNTSETVKGYFQNLIGGSFWGKSSITLRNKLVRLESDIEKKVNIYEFMFELDRLFDKIAY